MASRSRVPALRISTSAILLLLQFHFRFGETHVDRSDVAVAIERVAARNLERAARAIRGDVAALHEFGDVDHARRALRELIAFDRRRETRRNDFASVVVDRDEKLTAAGVVYDCGGCRGE